MAMASPVATTSFDSCAFFFINSSSSSTHHLNNHHFNFNSFPIKQSFTYTYCKQPAKSTTTCFCTNFNDESSLFSVTVDESTDVNDDDSDVSVSSYEEGIEIEIENLGKNARRIRSSVAIDASLITVWDLLTDYENLAEFIPSLAVSQVREKSQGFARLYQVGEQNLAFGLKFKAKGVVDCYEKDLEFFPLSQRRDIEFKMIEGDFQVFEGRWSIEQYSSDMLEGNTSPSSCPGQEYKTTLSYMVDVRPNMWLPVRLVESRLCREIKMNLSCIKEAAQNASQVIPYFVKPGDFRPYLCQGIIYTLMKKKDEADKQFDKYQKLVPNLEDDGSCRAKIVRICDTL